MAPSGIPISTKDSPEILPKIKQHEENLFTSRGKFFIVAQSMLFAGLAATDPDKHIWNFRTMRVFGIALGLISLWVGFLHFHFTRKKLEEHMSLAAEWYLEKGPGLSKRSFTYIAFVVPLAVCAAWIVFFANSFRN